MEAASCACFLSDSACAASLACTSSDVGGRAGRGSDSRPVKVAVRKKLYT